MLSRLRHNPTRNTWAITGLMAAAGGIMMIPLVGLSEPNGAPFHIHWWPLAILFAIVELGGIHISTRRGAHTLTLAELPVVLGLAASTPLALLAARIVGLLGTLSWVRWQNALKLSFNASNALFGTALAISVSRGVLGDYVINSPRGWLALAVGVTVEGLISGLLVAIVIAINDPDRNLPDIIGGLTVSWWMSLATAVVSILAFIALATSLWAAILGVLVIAGLVFAARIYGRLHARHEELTAVFGLTQALEGPLSVQQIVERVLLESGRFLRVDSAEFLHYNGAHKWRRGTLHQDGSVEIADLDPERARRITAALGHHVLHLDGEIPKPIAEWQDLSGIDRGVVSPLISRGEVVGALILGNRPGPLSEFSEEDLSLLSSFSDHVSAKIDQALTEERLRLEVEEKHQIIRSKDQLIAAVSHELRTPLTGILGFAETLREQGSSLDPEIMSEAIASIANESTDLANIVDDLLTAARFELGALSAHTTPTDLAAIAGRVIEALTSRVDLDIEAELRPAVAEVDAPRVRQILRNLITNASRYGGDRIVVRTARTNGTARIEVRDNGVGIGDADPEAIFGAYQSAHEPGTQPGSVGLGLTISRHLAQLMGGDLTFRRDEAWSVFALAFEDNPDSGSVEIEA